MKSHSCQNKFLFNLSMRSIGINILIQMRNAQQDVGELVMLCTYLILVPSEKWIDYLFNESIVRGAAFTQDNNGNRILVYPISRIDLPEQPDEYAAICTNKANILGKVRWMDVDKPLAHGKIYFVESIEDHDNIPIQNDLEVQINALTEGTFNQNSIVNLKNKNRNASLFNQQTYQGLNDMFIKLCKLLTIKNEQLLARKSNKNRLQMLQDNLLSLYIFCFLFNIYAYFIMFRWINPDFTVFPLIGLYFGSVICVLGQYFVLVLFIYVCMICCYNGEDDDDDESSGVMMLWYKIFHFLLSGVAIIFDFVILGLSMAHSDGRTATHITILSISAIISFVHFLWVYRSQSSKINKKKQLEKNRTLIARKYKPKPPNRNAKQDLVDNQVLLVEQDEEEQMRGDLTNINKVTDEEQK